MTKRQRKGVIKLLLDGLENTRKELEIAWAKNDKESAYLVDSLLTIEKNLYNSLLLLGTTPPKRDERMDRVEIVILKQKRERVL